MLDMYISDYVKYLYVFRYDRRQNLDLICNVLNHDFGIQARSNHRDDVVVGHDNKVRQYLTSRSALGLINHLGDTNSSPPSYTHQYSFLYSLATLSSHSFSNFVYISPVI